MCTGNLLTKPEIVLSKAEDREVKRVAKDLLEMLKREKLVLDWKKRQTTRATVMSAKHLHFRHLWVPRQPTERFRKTFACWHHERNRVSVNTLREWLGHESLDVTLAYLKGSDATSEPVQELVANGALAAYV